LGAEEGFKEFQKNDKSLEHNPIRRMSKLTQRILQSLDYKQIMKKRMKNFTFLHQLLKESNRLSIHLDGIICPMVYPYWTNDRNLRAQLIKNKIFVATYWPNVLKWTKKNSLEYDLAVNLIPIPIDQRYNLRDMSRIIQVIKKK